MSVSYGAHCTGGGVTGLVPNQFASVTLFSPNPGPTLSTCPPYACAMRKAILFTVVLSLVPVVAFAGVGGKNAAYVGGTATGVKDGAEGRFDAANDAALIFKLRDAAVLTIPYAAITELEYGQKA